jgi:hypothetical protein
MIEHVVERLASKRDVERIHVCEIGGSDQSRTMFLREHHFLVGAALCTPSPHSSLERPPL